MHVAPALTALLVFYKSSIVVMVLPQAIVIVSILVLVVVMAATFEQERIMRLSVGVGQRVLQRSCSRVDHHFLT